MTPLLLLAEKVEGLEGADREADAEIAAAIRYFPKGVGSVWQGGLTPNSPEQGRVECCTKLGTGGPHYAALSYTASLDAAMSLVPENADAAGERFRLEAYNSPGVLAPHVRASAWVAGAARVYAATPPLALVAACLRARAAMEAGE